MLFADSMSRCFLSTHVFLFSRLCFRLKSHFGLNMSDQVKNTF